MMAYYLKIAHILISGYSIECHQYDDIAGIDEYVDCTEYNNEFAKTLECLREKSEDVSTLASEFHDLQQECLASFDSCYHDRYYKVAGCTCIGGYIASIKHIDVKMGECKKFTPAEWIDHQFKALKGFKNYQRLMVEAKRLNCLQPKRMKSSLQKLLIPKKKHQTLSHEICTCQTDRCNEIDKTSETDYPGITTEKNSI